MESDAVKLPPLSPGRFPSVLPPTRMTADTFPLTPVRILPSRRSHPARTLRFFIPPIPFDPRLIDYLRSNHGVGSASLQLAKLSLSLRSVVHVSLRFPGETTNWTGCFYSAEIRNQSPHLRPIPVTGSLLDPDVADAAPLRTSSPLTSLFLWTKASDSCVCCLHVLLRRDGAPSSERGFLPPHPGREGEGPGSSAGSSQIRSLPWRNRLDPVWPQLEAGPSSRTPFPPPGVQVRGQVPPSFRVRFLIPTPHFQSTGGGTF